MASLRLLLLHYAELVIQFFSYILTILHLIIKILHCRQKYELLIFNFFHEVKLDQVLPNYRVINMLVVEA